MRIGGCLFKTVSSSDSSQTNEDTIFKYEQVTDLVMATYSGGDIRYGQMIGKILEDGTLDLRYQHMDRAGEIKTGICRTRVETMPSGRLRLYEDWQWTCGSEAKGQSILDEI